jgi:F-type H+-transporting ATPase subunit b
MRTARCMRMLSLLVLAAGIAAAQEHPPAATPEHTPGAATEHATGEHKQGPSDLWKWANFALLAGALGYMIGKNAGPFFESRTQQIKRDMLESAAARKAAESRVAEVEQRLANLESEIAALRAESQKELTGEAERMSQQIAAEIAKVQTHSEQEIVAAGKAARMELKRYSAHLAVGLAEEKIRNRMTPGTQAELVQSFVHNLK